MKLQLQDIDGIVLEEKEFVLSEGDTLVMVFNNEDIDYELAHHFFESVQEGLESDTSLVAIPSGIEFQVIKKSK
jgi:hypothetical protein